MIESYSFGRMRIDGKDYTSDLIIFPSKVKSSWWRKKGHQLCLDDLNEALKEKPEVLVIGTGSLGIMKVTDEVKKYTKTKKIHLIIEKTKKASQIYNDISSNKKTIGAFHLTC